MTEMEPEIEKETEVKSKNTTKKTKVAQLIIFLQIINLKFQMFNKIIAMKAKIHQLIMN